MIKRIFCFISVFIIVISCNCINVYATSDTYDLNQLINSTYMGNICSVSYYHPPNFPNVYVGNPQSNSNQYYIHFYDDNTTLSVSSKKVIFSNNTYCAVVNSKEEVEQILFEGNNGGTIDLTQTTESASWTHSFIYSTQNVGQTTTNGQSIEAYYYDYFYNKNGYYPIGVSITINYLCDDELIQSKDTETIAGTNILLQDIIIEPDGYKWKTIEINGNTEYVKADTFQFTQDTTIFVEVEKDEDNTGFFAGLWQDIKDLFGSIPETLKKILEIFYIPNKDISFLAEIDNILMENLEDNGFFTSIRYIERELTSIYSEDYTDPNGFYNLGLTKMTLRQPTIELNKDFGNDTTGNFNQSYHIQAGKIDWGLDNIDVMPMGWFFGQEYEIYGTGGYYSTGVKAYTDPLISAFLWIGFAFMLWQRLPDLISGELATMTAMTGDVINTQVAGERRMEDMYKEQEYTTIKTDMLTGEIKEYTKTQKRRDK